jgi:hypothetical protein
MPFATLRRFSIENGFESRLPMASRLQSFPT